MLRSRRLHPGDRSPSYRVAVIGVCALGFALLSGCGGGSAVDRIADEPAALSAPAALGQQIFADASLSASGRQSCASCHSPDLGHAPPSGLAVQLGGPLLNQAGVRAAPGLNYLSGNTGFRFTADGTPIGGFFWDGRAQSLRAQALEPFLNPREMANTNPADVIAKLARARYAEEFKRVFGADIFDRPHDALERIALSLQAYQLEDTDFRPFSSKYDEFLRGRAVLSAQETRGLALFNNPGKGNCAACHPSGKAADGSFPLFTDFTYDNLGVPRNAAIPKNDDPTYFDLGLCARADLAERKDLCGAFKVPSLRNVALRKTYFHNGRFSTLKDAVTFYVQRDTNPEKWYPLGADGSVKKFDDLPAQHHTNVNTTEAPYNRRKGDAPALSDAEVDDVVAFLKTLSDGYTP